MREVFLVSGYSILTKLEKVIIVNYLVKFFLDPKADFGENINWAIGDFQKFTKSEQYFIHSYTYFFRITR